MDGNRWIVLIGNNVDFKIYKMDGILNFFIFF